ncbi:MAG: helix-turn-helix domain-containing protein [Rhizobiales bacterium]|nr:helix-turn-helix domain-containing protein [Hyphomicrobiales bacterium]
MRLLSYRKAADRAGCSHASIQRAVKSGALKIRGTGNQKGFDPKEVDDWASERVDIRMLANAQSDLHTRWTGGFASIVAKMLPCKDQTFDAQCLLLKNEIFNFVRDFKMTSQYTDGSVAYREAVYGSLAGNLEFDGLDLEDREVKFNFCMYTFIKSQMFYLIGDLNNMGLVKKNGEYITFPPYDLLAIDSFSMFLEELERKH